MEKKQDSPCVSRVTEEDLSGIPRFLGLSRETLGWLSNHFVRECVPRGGMIFREGEPTDSFRLLERGAVKIYKTTESGREIVLHFFGPGESLGEAMLFEQGEFPASAMALESCRILRLPREDYLEMFSRDPKIAHATIRSLLFRNMQLTRRVYELGSGGVETRLARAMLGMIRPGSEEGDEKGTIPLALSRQELADVVGARVETVIRIVKQWERKGMLTTHKDGFTVDSSALMELIRISCE